MAKGLFEALAPHYGPSAEASEVVKVPGQGDWSPEMLDKLRKEVEPYRGAVALLDLAASRPDEEVRYFELTQSTSVPEKQIRSDLGAMSKASRELFGQKMWPLRAWQASDGIMSYVMPRTIAHWWLGQ